MTGAKQSIFMIVPPYSSQKQYHRSNNAAKARSYADIPCRTPTQTNRLLFLDGLPQNGCDQAAFSWTLEKSLAFSSLVKITAETIAYLACLSELPQSAEQALRQNITKRLVLSCLATSRFSSSMKVRAARYDG